MAFTTNLPFAGSDALHIIQMKANGETRIKYLPDLPKDDYEPLKGDLWKLHLKDYFGFSSCITAKDIEEIAIIPGSSDVWNIDSIVTFLVADQYYWELSSVDLDVQQWIGRNSYETFYLSITL